jgi:hypothetical protein
MEATVYLGVLEELSKWLRRFVDLTKKYDERTRQTQKFHRPDNNKPVSVCGTTELPMA